MAQQLPAQQLPDFDVLSTSFTNIAIEVRKMQNLPAVDVTRQLDEIKEQIRQMGRNIEQGFQRQEQAFQRQEQAFQRQFSRYEKNNIARIHNSRLSDETHRLEPFYNIEDEEIEGFPETSGDITRLNAAGVNALLRQLGLAENGGLENKKKRLRRHIGLMVL